MRCDFRQFSALIVEDSEAMQRLLASILWEFGIGTIEKAYDGQQALALLDRSKFDVVVTDHEMEPMGGLQLIQEIRAGTWENINPRLPIVMVTAHSHYEMVAKAGDLGIVHYLTKPISRGKLWERLNHIFGEQGNGDAAGPEQTKSTQVQAIIGKLSQEFVAQATNSIDEIFAAYKHAMQNPKDRPAMIEKIARIAHDMKGQGGSFGYPLMSEISESLGHFCKTTPDPRKTQLEVVTAHVDAMRAVVADDLKGDGGQTGTTLLSMLKAASTKYADHR